MRDEQVLERGLAQDPRVRHGIERDTPSKAEVAGGMPRMARPRQFHQGTLDLRLHQSGDVREILETRA